MAEKNKPLEQQFYMPPPKVSGWEAFKTFLWNSETSQLLGRTGSSWAKILLFYIVFYAALAGFFAAMLAVFFQTLDEKTPKCTLEKSIIGINPGLGFRPMPNDSNVDSTLIWYSATNKKSYDVWTEEIDRFLKDYLNPKHAVPMEQCNYNRPPGENKACAVPLDEFSPCTHDENYNFPKSGPCVFLKLNRIYGWIPEYFNATNDLPNAMSADLKGYITGASKTDPKMLNTVWVTCEGENPADKENIGPIRYIPQRGFPGYYFPFRNQQGYLSPLVAIFFERPKTGVLINVQCKAWARNIEHDSTERRGLVHFELMVD